MPTFLLVVGFVFFTPHICPRFVWKWSDDTQTEIIQLHVVLQFSVSTVFLSIAVSCFCIQGLKSEFPSLMVVLCSQQDLRETRLCWIWTWTQRCVPETAKKPFYHVAVDKALQSPNGHLDLFLRFLLGLSLQANHTVVQGLLTQKGHGSETSHVAIKYIKKKIAETPSAEKSINLFHCLNELNECSFVTDTILDVCLGRLSTDQLLTSQWSALVFILLSSEKGLDVFELKKIFASETALLKLLPEVKTSNKAQ